MSQTRAPDLSWHQPLGRDDSAPAPAAAPYYRREGRRVPLASVARDPAPSRPGNGPRAATSEDVLLRLALWLAEVAAEAALAAKAPEARSAPRRAAPRRSGRAGEPPAAESVL